MNSIMRGILAVVIVAAVLGLGIYIGRRGPAEQAAQAPAAAEQQPQAKKPATEVPTVARDPYQRSLAIFEFRKAADAGVDRGREIFYYKCWFCHNEFAEGAPKLTGVYSRGKLLSGRPATDDGIKDEIRNGGAGMAAYKYTLSDSDLDDLVAYVRDKCCWDSKSPPPNPRYRGGNEE
ncbi:MAG TPA: cytochrome c [Micropepsaceae bacterium]|nr:cytochrome c [Micropepsaceae bacterium]